MGRLCELSVLQQNRRRGFSPSAVGGGCLRSDLAVEWPLPAHKNNVAQQCGLAGLWLQSAIGERLGMAAVRLLTDDFAWKAVTLEGKSPYWGPCRRKPADPETL